MYGDYPGLPVCARSSYVILTDPAAVRRFISAACTVTARVSYEKSAGFPIERLRVFFFFARSGKRIFFVHANRRNWRYDKCHVGYVVFIAIITQQTTKQLCFLDNSGLRNFSGTFRPSISANSSIRSCPIEIFIRDIELEMRMTENDGMSWRKWRERIFNGFKAEEGKDVGPSPFLGRKLAFFLNWGFLSLCHNSYKI